MYPENFPFSWKTAFREKFVPPFFVGISRSFFALLLRLFRREEWKQFRVKIFLRNDFFSEDRRDCFCFVLWNCRILAYFSFRFFFENGSRSQLEVVMLYERRLKKFFLFSCEFRRQSCEWVEAKSSWKLVWKISFAHFY